MGVAVCMEASGVGDFESGPGEAPGWEGEGGLGSQWFVRHSQWCCSCPPTPNHHHEENPWDHGTSYDVIVSLGPGMVGGGRRDSANTLFLIIFIIFITTAKGSDRSGSAKPRHTHFVLSPVVVCGVWLPFPILLTGALRLSRR